jgi:steroid delta-isomerase-like uncharacterized protein
MKIDGNRKQDRATELVLTYYSAFNRGDWDSLLALLADDVAHDPNQDARESGREAFAAHLARMRVCCHEQLRDIVVLVAPDGDRAAAEYVIYGEYLSAEEGQSAAHGQKYELPGGAFFEIREDRIARVSHFYSQQAWLAQVSG